MYVCMVKIKLKYRWRYTDEDPSLRIESFAINLRGISTKLYFNKYYFVNIYF